MGAPKRRRLRSVSAQAQKKPGAKGLAPKSSRSSDGVA
jgi:hypothetical protein